MWEHEPTRAALLRAASDGQPEAVRIQARRPPQPVSMLPPLATPPPPRSAARPPLAFRRALPLAAETPCTLG